MLFFFIFLFSFIFFFKSFTCKPPMKSTEFKSLWLSPFFWEEIAGFFMSWFHKNTLAITGFCQVPNCKMSLMTLNLGIKEAENFKEEKTSLLDLPDLALESILEKLPPSGLCSMAGVCSYLRERCTSDHLWEKHLKHKWGSLIGDAAFREWQWHIASTKRLTLVNNQTEQKGLLGSLGIFWPISWIKPKFESKTRPKSTSSLPVNSIMAMDLSLENGKFWFPAQVYNRENGHVGFLMSCYDAQVSYDSRTDTFQARYSPYGRRMLEDGIQWERLRAPPIDTPAYDLHISDCLNDLKPGDHIEIQWRRSKEFPYGWWYAVIGHVESCGGNDDQCRCHSIDMVVLDFNQYSPGSRWRKTIINRKDHKEEGNEGVGFYGGIRKLCKEEEVSMWKKLWPSQIYE